MSSSMMMMNEEEEKRRIIRYLKSFPPGFRFHPTEEELIVEYLKKKLQNSPLPINLIKDVHLYNHNPWELTENFTSYGENEFYFFTPRDREYAIGPSRVAGIGYWKSSGQVIPIYDSNGVEIGSKRLLVFYKRKVPNGNGDKTSWVMHEYKAKDEDAESTSTDGTTANVRAATTVVTRSVTGGDMQLDEWVLCKIYKKAEEESAATPPPPPPAAAAAENRLNIIENTATRVENPATREGNTSRDIYIGTSDICYDRDTFLLWQSNKCVGKVFKRAEEPAATPPASPIEIIQRSLKR